MLDLETLGNAPGCVIVAIGAVRFNKKEITDQFYTRVDPDSCVKAGLKLDTDTVLWWLKQKDEARLEITKPGDPLLHALDKFSHFAQWGNEDIELWGNGAAFDNAILAAAYRALGRPAPWKFSNDRCYRTMKNLLPQVTIARGSGTQHNALDDARAQAEHLIRIENVINGCLIAK